MKRLIEKTVFSGFVMPCRFATWPTRISPSLVKPTTEAVRRLPSWFAITVGLPPSTTATTEFVVPRSIPMTFAMSLFSNLLSWERAGLAPSPCELRQVDLDFLRLDLFHLRQPDLEHAVAVGGLHLVRLHGNRQRHRALELAVHALEPVVPLVLRLTLEATLTLHGQHVAGDRDVHVLLVDPR